MAGISLGGGLAAAAGEAHFFGRDAPLYARQLILNPLLQARWKEDALVKALNANPLTRFGFVGWGPGCRHERSLGRAGICTFQIANLAAARDFGYNLVSNLTAAKNGADVAVIYDQADPVVRTSTVRKLISKYAAVLPAKNTPQHCVLNFTQHSMLSMYVLRVGARRGRTRRRGGGRPRESARVREM